MTRSRWGDARPVSKCAGLSIVAHIFLVGIAYVTNLIPNAPPTANSVQVSLVDDEAVDAAAEAWEESPTDFIPDRSSQALEPETTTTDEPVRSAPTAHSSADSFVDAWEPDEELPELPDAPNSEFPMDEFPMEHSLVDSADVDQTIVDTESREFAETEQADEFKNKRPESDIAHDQQYDEPFDDQPLDELPEPTETVPLQHITDAHEATDWKQDSDSQRDLDSASNVAMMDELHESSRVADQPNSPDGDLIHGEQDQFVAAAERDQMQATDPTSRASSPRETSAAPNRIDAPRRATPIQYASRRSSPTGNRYSGRTQRRALRTLDHGGDESTEAAVEAALAWLAAAQDADGRWDASMHGAGRGIYSSSHNRSNSGGASADTAITGLALLAFLGSGHSHLDGPYQKNVQRGLEFLLRSQSRSSGSFAGHASPMAAMYCHGISTLAVSEALVMTDDARIRPFLEKAIRYTLASQHPTTGGWRYRPGDTGDTSQFGWQLMSLMSARETGMRVPDEAIAGMRRWIKSVSQGRHGGLASYRPYERPSLTMTAEALVCRLFVNRVWNENAINEAADMIAREGIGKQLNLYYCYYASVGLFQIQDRRWASWNKEMKSRLLPLQRQDGKEAGSWDPNTTWGANGGRVYSTSMAALCLETYYRFLPFYRQLEAARSFSRERSRQ